MGTFGAELRRLRTARRLSLRRLAELVSYDFGYLGQLERGARPSTSAVAAACDRALDGGGTLVAQAGHVADGLRYSAGLLDDVPAEQHNGLLYGVARQVMAVVPATERRRTEVGELQARLPAAVLS